MCFRSICRRSWFVAVLVVLPFVSLARAQPAPFPQPYSSEAPGSDFPETPASTPAACPVCEDLSGLTAALDEAEQTLNAYSAEWSASSYSLNPSQLGTEADDEALIAQIRAEIEEDLLENPFPGSFPPDSTAGGAPPMPSEENSQLFGLPPPKPRDIWRMQRIRELWGIIDRSTQKKAQLILQRAAVAAALGAPDSASEELEIARLKRQNYAYWENLVGLSLYLETVDNPLSCIYVWTWDSVCGGSISSHISRAKAAAANLESMIAANKKRIAELQQRIVNRPKELQDLDARILEQDRIIADSQELLAKFQRR